MVRHTVYEAPPRFRPYGIAAGKHGQVWISGYDSSMLLEVDPRTEQARVHELYSAPSAAEYLALRDMPDSARTRWMRSRGISLGARRIAADADGGIWISGFRTGRVARFDPETAEVDDHPSPGGSQPYGIAVAADGIVWYGQKTSGTVVALDPGTRERVTFRIPSREGVVRHLAVDVRRRRVWLPLSDAGRIGLIPVRRN